MGKQHEPIVDRSNLAIAALLLYAAAFAIWVIVQPGSAETRSLASDSAFIPVGIVAALLAWRTAAHPSHDRRTRRAWTLVGIALVLNWLGDGVWLILDLRHVEPFPSVADAAYLAFYPVLLAGLLSFPVSRHSLGERTTLGLDAGIVMLGGFMVVWYLVLGETLRLSGDSGLAKALSVAYPVGDLVLLFGIAIVVLRHTGEKVGRALSIMVGGMALFVVADLSYGRLSLEDAYTGGDWPDAFWMAAQVAFAIAALHQHRQLSAATGGERISRRDVQSISRLPYLAVVVSFALLVNVARGEAAYPLGGLLVGAVALTALVVGRQVTALRENIRLLADFHHLAVTDGLTGLQNRRRFFEIAELEFARAKRSGRALAIVMIDIDHFKVINDTHGHATADAVLTGVGAACTNALRSYDVLARYGGDELVALLPDTDLDAAAETASRLQDAVLLAGLPVPVTLSLGVATDEGCADLPTTLHRADAALYAAKESGRDCVRAFVAAVPTRVLTEVTSEGS
jgi:diguanylate cyclase (GGDEF)-like protein